MHMGTPLFSPPPPQGSLITCLPSHGRTRGVPSSICTTADHEAMKRDWRWELLVPVGVQYIDADGDEPAITLDMRNCFCGSTLAMEVR